jgi:hypothetical protein
VPIKPKAVRGSFTPRGLFCVWLRRLLAHLVSYHVALRVSSRPLLCYLSPPLVCFLGNGRECPLTCFLVSRLRISWLPPLLSMGVAPSVYASLPHYPCHHLSAISSLFRHIAVGITLLVSLTLFFFPLALLCFIASTYLRLLLPFAKSYLRLLLPFAKSALLWLPCFFAGSLLFRPVYPLLDKLCTLF